MDQNNSVLDISRDNMIVTKYFYFKRQALTTNTANTSIIAGENEYDHSAQDAGTNIQTHIFIHFIGTEPILIVFTYSSSAASLVGVVEQYWWRWGATKLLWIRALYIYSPSHSLHELLVLHDLFVKQLFGPVILHRLIHLPIYLSNTHFYYWLRPKFLLWMCTLKRWWNSGLLRAEQLSNWITFPYWWARRQV